MKDSLLSEKFQEKYPLITVKKYLGKFIFKETKTSDDSGIAIWFESKDAVDPKDFKFKAFLEVTEGTRFLLTPEFIVDAFVEVERILIKSGTSFTKTPSGKDFYVRNHSRPSLIMFERAVQDNYGYQEDNFLSKYARMNEEQRLREGYLIEALKQTLQKVVEIAAKEDGPKLDIKAVNQVYIEFLEEQNKIALQAKHEVNEAFANQPWKDSKTKWTLNLTGSTIGSSSMATWWTGID